ncbi:MAG TPA: hypothetical protein VG847_14190 [Chitinophagaceae bacterium]|nr:hypothetical protein [Chitinophagaceae bacterium]
MQTCWFLYRKLKNIEENIHRGEILRKAVKKSGLSIELVTGRAGYKRSTFYLHTKRADLSLEILAKYEKAIRYDFSDEIPEMNKFALDEEQPDYGKEPVTLQEAIKQLAECKDKYLALLEKYTRIIESSK